MPTYTEMRQQVIDRIAKLRKTSDDIKKMSEAPRKFVMDTMMGVITPTNEDMISAVLAIKHADDIIIYCFNVEEQLRKLAAAKGICLGCVVDTGCKRCHTDFTPEHFNTNGLCMSCFAPEPDAEDE
jgi:hypothetical protein